MLKPYASHKISGNKEYIKRKRSMRLFAFQHFISLWLSDSSDLHTGETQRYFFFIGNRLKVPVFIDLCASSPLWGNPWRVQCTARGIFGTLYYTLFSPALSFQSAGGGETSLFSLTVYLKVANDFDHPNPILMQATEAEPSDAPWSWTESWAGAEAGYIRLRKSVFRMAVLCSCMQHC